MLSNNERYNIIHLLYKGIDYVRDNASHLSSNDMRVIYHRATKVCKPYAKKKYSGTGYQCSNPLKGNGFCYWDNAYCTANELGKKATAKSILKRLHDYDVVFYRIKILSWVKNKKKVSIKPVNSIDMIDAFYKAVDFFKEKVHLWSPYRGAR